MNKKVIVNALQVTAYPKHQQYLNALNISITSAKLVDVTRINLEYFPPRSIEFRPLLIDIINEKYVHLEDLSLSYVTEKNIGVTALNLALLPPRLTSATYFSVYHRTLRSIECTSLELILNLVPTRTKFHNTNIRAIKIPRRDIAALDIAFGMPYKVVDVKVPLTTFHAKWFKSEISGSGDQVRKQVRTNIIALYDGGIDYFGFGNSVNKVRTKIITGQERRHRWKTDIYIDYDSWTTRYDYLKTNVKTSGTITNILSNHLYVLGGSTKKLKSQVLGKKGLYLDNIPAKTSMMGMADAGAFTLWFTQNATVGYSEFNTQIKYGFIVKIPNNIAGYNVDKSWLGIPLLGTHTMDLDVVVSLLVTNNDVVYSYYKTPTQLLDEFAPILGVDGKILRHQSFGYIDITDLTKQHQAMYTGGPMVLQVMPSYRMLYQDMVLNKPFLYRVFNIDTNGNFNYKIFNKQETI